MEQKNYHHLKTSLSDIIKEVEELTSITVNSTTFQVIFYFCSDLKFLAIACGIESATATYSCIWCKCPSSERHNMSKNWSITDTQNGGARTVTEIITDVLFNLLITDIRRHNAIAKATISIAELNSTYLQKFEFFINVTYKIPFQFFVSKESKQMQWRDLMGPEKHVVLDKINLPEVFLIYQMFKKFKNYGRISSNYMGYFSN